jgi:hypothetical protein
MHQARGRTGPITERGKQIASRNAAKHNCTSSSLIVGGEIQADFDALLESLVSEYLPETEMQRIRVQEAARATWELHRAHREFDKSQVRLYQQQPNMCDWTATQQAELTRMARYRTRAERAYHRALQSVECLRTMRLRAEQRAFWENLQTAKLDLSERRHGLTVERYEFTVECHKLTLAVRERRQQIDSKEATDTKTTSKIKTKPTAPSQSEAAHKQAVQKQSAQQSSEAEPSSDELTANFQPAGTHLTHLNLANVDLANMDLASADLPNMGRDLETEKFYIQPRRHLDHAAASGEYLLPAGLLAGNPRQALVKIGLVSVPVASEKCSSSI